MEGVALKVDLKSRIFLVNVRAIVAPRNVVVGIHVDPLHEAWREAAHAVSIHAWRLSMLMWCAFD